MIWDAKAVKRISKRNLGRQTFRFEMSLLTHWWDDHAIADCRTHSVKTERQVARSSWAGENSSSMIPTAICAESAEFPLCAADSGLGRQPLEFEMSLGSIHGT